MHKDSARIPNPCHEDWGAMSGDDQKRFCASCSKHVHDLSSMPEAAAEALLGAHDDLCVRYRYDARTGRIRFADSPPASTGLAARFALAAAALLGAPTAYASAAPADGPPPCSEGSVLDRIVEAVREVIGDETAVTGEVAPMGQVAVDPTWIPEVSAHTIPEVGPQPPVTVIHLEPTPLPETVRMGIVAAPRPEPPPPEIEVMGDVAPPPPPRPAAR